MELHDDILAYGAAPLRSAVDEAAHGEPSPALTKAILEAPSPQKTLSALVALAKMWDVVEAASASHAAPASLPEL